MQEVSFIYFRNFFNNATKGSFKRMLILSRDHHDKLKQRATTNPAFIPLFEDFLPAFTAFETALTQVGNIALDRQQYTMRVETAFEQLRGGIIEDWDIRIAFRYRPSTPDYQFLMGIGRTGFYSGSYEQNLRQVRDLIDRLGRYSDLADVKTDVEAWYNATNAHRTHQQGLEGGLQSAQTAVEETRQQLADAMYKVYGGLITIYYNKRWELENFYEIKYLQRTTSTADKATNAENTPSIPQKTILVDANTVILQDTFIENESIEIYNSGTTDNAVWLSSSATSARPATATIVAAGERVLYYVEELTDGSAPLAYLIAENLGIVAGKIGAVKLQE